MKVLFLGFADLSVDLAKYQADCVSIWTMNDFYYWFPGLRPDMVFEIHKDGEIEKCQQQGRFPGDYKAAYNESGADIITRFSHGLDNECDVKLDVLLDTFGEKFFVGTFSYMFAWAMQMHFRQITLEGIFLREQEEYATQIPGMLRNIDEARRRKIDVTVAGGRENTWRSIAPSIRENWQGIYGGCLPDTCDCESCIEFRAKFREKGGLMKK